MPIPPEIEFEKALAELETIVEALERGGPDLSQALAGYTRGVELLGHCQGVLDQAERSVALLTGVDEAGQPLMTPFDAAATGASGGAGSTVVEVVEAVPPPRSVAPARKPKAAASVAPVPPAVPNPAPATV